MPHLYQAPCTISLLAETVCATPARKEQYCDNRSPHFGVGKSKRVTAAGGHGGGNSLAGAPEQAEQTAAGGWAADSAKGAEVAARFLDHAGAAHGRGIARCYKRSCTTLAGDAEGGLGTPPTDCT